MTREQAIRRLKKMFGERYCFRVGDFITSPEDRAAAREELLASRARRDAIDQEIKERLAALDWYQALKAERRTMAETAERAAGRMTRYRFLVGKRDNILGAFHVMGEGDTWEEAFAAAEAKRAPKEKSCSRA